MSCQEIINAVVRIVLFAVAMLTLNGCAYLFIKPYGYVSPDAESIRENGRAIYIPKNAPSISQGYNPEPTRTSTPKNSSDNNLSAHEGIDIFGKTKTPVIAPAAGIVIKSYFEPMYGNRIVIDHGKDENGLFIRSRYFHLKKRLVKKGDTVVRGQQIGTLGRTGLLAAGIPHLHYEIRFVTKQDQWQSKSLNPHRYWMDGAGIVTCFDSSKHYTDNSFRTTYPVPCLGVDWQ